MQYLHSYWRMDYIEAPKPVDENRGTSPFLELLKDEDERKSYVLYRSQYSFLILNKFPYNAGHLMALPKREVADLAELSGDERLDFMNIIIKGQDILGKALRPHGYNIGMNIGRAGGAGIPKHLHCHIVPRWEGDTNFMPVIAETKVLPEALDKMWLRLREFC